MEFFGVLSSRSVLNHFRSVEDADIEASNVTIAMLKSHGFKDPEVKLGSIGRSLPVQVIAVETADDFLLSISNLCLIFLQAFLISIFSVLASKKGESKTPEAHQGSCFHLALLLNFQPIYMEYFYSGLGGKLVPLMME